MFETQPRADVEALLKDDSEFRQLYYRHKELDKQVMDAELGVLPIDDTTLV
ncbi:MAG TPA: YdcH family protein, partial [Myxococcota bacterium]|nr:YdcH family protein [Myxococcota bacterium]